MFYNGKNRNIYLYLTQYQQMLTNDKADLRAAMLNNEDQIECSRRIRFVEGQQLAIKKIKAMLQENGI